MLFTSGNSFHRGFDIDRDHADIAVVHDLEHLRWSNFQHLVVSPELQRRFANFSRAESCAAAIGRTAVKGDADDGDINVFQLAARWQAHKCGYAVKRF
jgi:hypothetical protein